LTVIALALSIIALNPWIAPTRVDAAATSQEGVVAAILAVVTQIWERELQERENMPAELAVLTESILLHE
jgi:hypothetical protein